MKVILLVGKTPYLYGVLHYWPTA